MSTSDTKVNSLCDDNLEGCKFSAGKKISDEELFKQPPTEEDCPICFIRIPSLVTGWGYYACCGKRICSGCARAPVYDDQGNKVDEKKCPFCRSPWPTCKEEIEWEKKRMELDDPIAIGRLGCYYRRGGIFGFPQDYTKALELWHRAAELGSAKAYNNIGACYDNGYGVEVDGKKARLYYELAAMAGDVTARHNLGNNELGKGNYDRALKHFLIAARNGEGESLERIKLMYTHGYATKDVYIKSLRSYQEYLGEIN